MEEEEERNKGFILIVEDDRGTSELEAQRLEPLGLEIRLAASAEETIAILKTAAPELMLLDYSLPGGNAIDVLRRLHESAIAIPPFIVVTGRGDEAVAVETMKSGAQDYIVKTADFLQNLLPAAGKALEKIALTRKLEAAQKSTAKNLRLYSFLAQVNLAAAQTKDRSALFSRVCEIAVKTGGMRMAWVGLPDRDLGRITPFCQAGFVDGYLDSIKIGMGGEEPESKGPAGQAAASGKICAYSDDIATDPAMTPWREKALERNYHSAASIPLEEDGRLAAVLSMYSQQPRFFTEDELKLLNEIKADISLALDAISAEEKRGAAQAALQRTAGQLAHVMEANPVILFTLRRKNGQAIPEWVSGNARALTGYEPAEILTLNWWAENLHPLDKDWAIAFQNNLPPKGLTTHDFRFRKKDGSYFWVHAQYQASAPETGEVAASWTDITPLKESETRFQELFEKTPIGYQSMDAEGRLLAVNDTWAKIFGRARREALGRPMADYLTPRSHAAFTECFSRFKRDGAVHNAEFEIEKPDGSRRWLGLSGQVARNSDGTFRQAHCILNDVTEKRAQKKQMRLLSDAIKTSFNEIYIFDALTFKFIFVNHGATKNLGYGAEELGNLAPWDLKKEYTEASFRAKVAPLLERKANMLFFESAHTRKDGTMYPVEVRLQLVESNGDKLFLSVINDITERRKAEQQARLNEARLECLARINAYMPKNQRDLLDFALGEAIKLTDSRLGYIYHYREDLKQFTLNAWSREAMAECRVRNPQTVYQLDKTGIWGEVVRQRRPIIINDFRAPDPRKKGYPAGHVELTNFLTVPVFSEGEIVLVAGVANKSSNYTEDDARQLTLLMNSIWEIIERKRAEEKSAKMLDELANMQRVEALGALAGGIAHDFNNMLTGIMANLSLLSTKAAGKENSEIIHDTLEATRNAQTLTTQLLAFSKGGKPVKKEFCFETALKEIFNLATRGAKTANKIELDERLWSVEGDDNQLKQAVNNLLVNALQAMPDGGTLRLKAENLPLKEDAGAPLPPGDYIRISVSDTGIGIPKEYLGRIFEPYFTTKARGHGLGLSMVWSVVKNHGGHIEARSEPGRGTTFELLLPATGRCLKTEMEKEREIQKGSGRILLLEDEEIVKRAAVRMLSELGYACETTSDGAETLRRYADEKAAGRPFDAVIMDLTIPGGMGGKDAGRELRRADPAARLVVSSGYSDEAVMADYRDYGFDAVLPKPYRFEDLAETLARLLKK